MVQMSLQIVLNDPLNDQPAVVQTTAWGQALVSTNDHDDVIKWKHFPRYWPFVRIIHRSPVNSPHKGQWRGALMFSLKCVWINGWVNNREAGDLRRYHAHYDVTVMMTEFTEATCVSRPQIHITTDTYVIMEVSWKSSQFWHDEINCRGNVKWNLSLISLKKSISIVKALTALFQLISLIDESLRFVNYIYAESKYSAVSL